MCNVRFEVEQSFGDVQNFFKFVDFKKQFEIGLNAIRKYYVVCGLLHNARVCCYDNVSSDYFGLQPQTISLESIC